MEESAEKYIAHVMGITDEERVVPEPVIRKISAIALLKNYEVRDQNILILCKDFVGIAKEIQDYLGKSIACVRRQSNMTTVETVGLNKIYCLTSDKDHWGIKGVRAQVLIVEGKREEADEQFLNEVVWPMGSIIFNPHIAARLSVACGEQIYPFAKRVELIFSEDVPY